LPGNAVTVTPYKLPFHEAMILREPWTLHLCL